MAKRSGEIPQQLPTEGPAPPPPQPQIKAATGTATAFGGTGGGRLATKAVSPGTASASSTLTGDISLGRMIEASMEQAIKDIQAESEALWAGTEEDRQAQIAVLNTPDAIRDRMLQARAKVKADWDKAYAGSG